MGSQQLFDWLLDNLASPVAPTRWLAKWTPAKRWGHNLFQLGKGLAVLLWAVGFVGVWFLAFWVLLIWDAVSPPGLPSEGKSLPFQTQG